MADRLFNFYIIRAILRKRYWSGDGLGRLCEGSVSRHQFAEAGELFHEMFLTTQEYLPGWNL